jgi:signal transduction histidine kinase
MKYKLSKKFFSITIIILLGLMAVTLLFQLLFFQPFYEKKRQDVLIEEVSRFKNMYSFQLNNSKDISNALKSFEMRTSSKIAIFTSDLNLKYVTDDYSKEDKEAVAALTSYCSELLKDNSLMTDVIKNKTIKSTTFFNQSSGMKKIAVVSSMSLSSDNDAIVIAVAPIAPIEEAAGVISEFYIYIAIGYLFVAIILALIYSNLISKPIVKIDKIAKKMSSMDFSETCDTSRNDEIGRLASTLNFLSTNLNKSLNELKEKNAQLELDIEKERSLELMRKDFIASVSHELKTPIGIIEGYAEGIKDGIVDSENASLYLETIIDESKKMAVLVSNMLELSKLESGVIKPNFELFNINRLIKKLIKKHSKDAVDLSLELEFIENTEYSYVFADVFQMEQVLTNLITNALKYTPKDNKIIISICKEEPNYKLSVINTGASIATNEIDKLFNKFYRIDKARSRNTNSSGLGLSIIKNILELHNFKYSLNNIENGVEFTFYLPIAEE